jgi:chromatin remodeling complex protein RSC6
VLVVVVGVLLAVVVRLWSEVRGRLGGPRTIAQRILVCFQEDQEDEEDEEDEEEEDEEDEDDEEDEKDEEDEEDEEVEGVEEGEEGDEDTESSSSATLAACIRSRAYIRALTCVSDRLHNGVVFVCRARRRWQGGVERERERERERRTRERVRRERET